MKINVKFQSPDWNELRCMGDLYNILFITEEPIGNTKVRMLHVGIFNFNSGRFMSAGEEYGEDKVISWGAYDFRKIQTFIP